MCSRQRPLRRSVMVRVRGSYSHAWLLAPGRQSHAETGVPLGTAAHPTHSASRHLPLMPSMRGVKEPAAAGAGA